eukprot:754104-Hanusia_phi.AAC.5
MEDDCHRVRRLRLSTKLTLFLRCCSTVFSTRQFSSYKCCIRVFIRKLADSRAGAGGGGESRASHGIRQTARCAVLCLLPHVIRGTEQDLVRLMENMRMSEQDIVSRTSMMNFSEYREDRHLEHSVKFLVEEEEATNTSFVDKSFVLRMHKNRWRGEEGRGGQRSAEKRGGEEEVKRKRRGEERGGEVEGREGGG